MNSKQSGMLGTCCYLVNTQNPVPSWSSQHTIRQPFKSTLLTKSIQSMCKYRLCNLDSQRSLHIAEGAISSLRNHALLKLLTCSRIFYCHYVMDSLTFSGTLQSSWISHQKKTRAACAADTALSHIWIPGTGSGNLKTWLSVLGHITNKRYLQNQECQSPRFPLFALKSTVLHKILCMYTLYSLT